jgi:hypothetical protein
MTFLFGIWGWFRGSLITQIVVGAVAFLGIWKLNNIHQQQIGGNKREAVIVENTQKAGRKRNDKAKKIRRRIKPSAAAERLWNDYNGAD